MKILILADANSVHVMRWANAFLNIGYDVTIISCANHHPNEKIKYNKNIRFIFLKYKAPIGYYLNAIELKKIVKKEKFDIINIHYASGYGTLGRMAGLKHALLNVWGSDVYDFPYESIVKMNIIKKNLRYYDFVASTSNCMAKQSCKLFNRKIYITPFGVDTKLFKPEEGKRNPNIFLFGTVKTLSPKYAISDTIKGFILVYKRLISEGYKEIAEKLNYEIYGDGWQKDELQNLINKNKMGDKIKLCGYVKNDQLPEILNRFDVFCSNSNINSESFGVAAVEAMACGVPVIVSDADGFKEVVENKVTGLIVPKGDIEAIAEAMYYMIFNKEERENFGNEGVKRVQKFYNWDDNVSTMEDVLKKMIVK